MVKVNTKLFIFFAMFVIVRCTDSITDMKPSVAFVIDDTASMDKVIEQVKEKAEDIFRAVYESKASIIGDFILVTFNDYEVFKDEGVVMDYARVPVKVRTVTRDPVRFLKKLDEIIVEGGGECPEMCLSGIYVAMEKCKPNSYIYVFTDSSSKDYHLKQTIENLAQRKSVQITFLLTKGNPYCDIEDDTLYRNISKATSGEVFRLNEHDISEILDYISLRIQSPQTSLLTVPIQPGTSNIRFSGDKDMKNLTVKVNCEVDGFVGVNVIGPDGNKAPTDNLVNVDNTKVLLIQNPADGNYVANINSNSAGEASVKASVTVDFLHGFSTFDSSPSSMKNTKTRPVPDEESYLAIQLKLSGTIDAKVETIHITDMNDKELMSMPANVANEKDKIYVSAAFRPPNALFKIMIVAVDLKTCEEFKRWCPTPIQPQSRPAIRLEYKQPEVTIGNSPKIEVIYGDSIKLECKVKAYPKPVIEWEDKETGRKLPSKVSILELPYDYISHLEINNVNKEGVYKCKAISSKTVVTDEIEVKTFRPRFLNILESPKDTMIDYKKDSKIYCKIEAWPPGHVTWYRDDKELVNDANFDISNDKSTLLIKKMSPELEGSYSCRATNDEIYKTSYFTLSLSGIERPIFDKTYATSTVEEGSILLISCRIIKGWPTPTITWEFKKNDANEFVSLAYTGLDIQIDSVNVDNAGIYRCHAENIVGKDYHEIVLTVQCKPKIEKSNSKVIVKLGEQAFIPCRIKKGIPEPDITWEFKRKGATDFIGITETKESHNIALADSENAGVYKCVAKNVVGEDSHETELTVLHPPEINKIESTKTVNEASDIEISCSIIKGFPKPEITWEFKGKDTNKFRSLPHTDQVIYINNAALKNAGVYKCQASNLIGKDEHQIILHVHCIPEIDHSKSTIEVKRGSKVSIPCRITKGVPEPVITWKLKKYDMSDFVSLSETGQQLKVHSADSRHMGLYKCIAVNMIGEDSHETELIVQYPPKIEKITKTKTATVGTKAVIECRILEGLPKPMITWEFKRQDANEFISIRETELEIDLVPVELDDAGVYKCFANNKLGHDSHEIKFTVTNAPNVIVSEPVTVKVGEKVTLSCEVTGEPKPDVKWIKDGITIEANAKYTIFSDLSLRFVASLGDEGDYACEAKNSLGEDSKNTTLQIYGPIIIDPPAVNPIYVNVGTDVKLPCKASAIPVPEIQWHFFSAEPNVESRSFESDKELLTISKIQENSAGYYRCLAYNGYEKKAITYEVVVNVPVEIEKPVKTEFTIVKNDYVLKIPCKAKGSPKPKVSWLRNFKTISTNDYHEVDSDGTLKIKNPNEFSAGNYLCVAESTRSSAFQLFTVRFTSTLTLSEPTETIYVEEDQSKEIECKLPHKSTDTIRWYKNGEEMRQPTNHFKIHHATAFDAGVYSCRVISFQGSKTAHMRIELGTKPDFENKKDNRIMHTFIEGRKSLLDCFAKGKPSPTLTWWHNGIKLKESSNSYTINELNENHLGEYRCEAKNDFGAITRTHVLQKIAGCIINYNENEGYKFHPVLRTKSGELAHFESKNGVMYIPESEPIECLCPNSIRKFYCVENQMFLIAETKTIHAKDRKIKYADLKCDNEMEPSEENAIKGQRCVQTDPKSRLIRIGYKSGEFSALYDVCINKKTQNRFFIKYDVSRYASDFKIGSHPFVTKNCNSQNNFNGKIRHGCCSGRSVVNPEDVSLDTQKATYLNINIVPQWNCSNYVNLDEIDRRIRKLAKSTPRDVVVFGGEFDLNSRASQTIAPKYLWKVVAIRQIYKALAIVTINVPDLTEEEARKLQRAICPDICANINWMNNKDWHDVKLGYTFCCDPEEFAEKVIPTFKNMFPTNVLDTV